MASSKKYWRSVEELKEDSSIVEKLKQNEFVEEIPTDKFLGDKKTLESSSTSRRDFLKYVGFSTAAASLAACEGRVVKSIPYIIKPDNVVPGVADYYASTMADGYDFANILVKVREGRPIKIEPNKLAAVNKSTNARVQASVLSLYDNNRLRAPKAANKNTTWSSLNKGVITKLEELKAANEKIVLLTSTLASPSTDKIIDDFKNKYGDVKHVVYDAVSKSGAVDAFEEVYGYRALPDYHFENADVIVSIGADFLGDWQGGDYSADYSKGRIPKKGKMSRHIQFESNLSLTGSNADKRVPLKPSEQRFALINLYNEVTGSNMPSKATTVDKAVKQAADEIKKAGKRAVVVTDINDKNAQLIALALNNALNSEVLDVAFPKYTRVGNDSEVSELVSDMNAGKIGGLITYNVNPSYTLPNANEFNAGLKKVKLSVAFAMSDDETSKYSQYVAATPHYLESWGDVQIKKGHYSLMQPTIQHLFDTKQFQDSLLKWMGSDDSYYSYLKNYWNTSILNGSSWNKALRDGIFVNKEITENKAKDINVANAAEVLVKSTKTGKLELAIYTKTGIGDGSQANNPWLQELPDPITRTTWDNYILISRVDAEAMGLKNWNVSNGALNGNRVNVSVGKNTIKNIPVYIQPGQAKGSVGIALGYGRTRGMQKEMMTGVNAYPFFQNFDNNQVVKIEKTEGEHQFACVQLQNTLMGRNEIIKETTLHDFNNKPIKEWNETPLYSLNHKEVPANKVDLWSKFDDTIGPHFNLAIDLATCTGCGACTIACQAENNIPVVGKHEIRVSRDMQWLRIDRYYSSDMTVKKAIKEGIKGTGEMFNAMVHPSDYPQVSFQPVMCQHCNHAPCETVCPVAATSHGRQGQNQMAYNRCVGTRYCANNCPYKVRRFNWFKYNENSEFDYNMNNDLGRMVLNPDVVVRSRGVMEKCSLCIQKTQASILKAKKEGRPVKDEEFQTACSNACTTGAIVFGDVNDEESKVKELKQDKRAFHLLEEVGTKPNVFYQLKVINKEA